MQPFILTIKGIDTVGTCVIVETSTYSDTINKNQVYNNALGKLLVVKNKCSTPFSIQGKTVFTQSDAFGSNFTASINTTVVPANSTINIQVYYNGAYKGTNMAPVYTFTINGKSVTYNLTVVVADTQGVITSIVIPLNNRQSRILTANDFTSKFTDIDGDTIKEVMLYGDTSTIRYNGNAYLSGTPVLLTDVLAGKLSHVAPLTDASSMISLTYKIKDSKNNIIE